MRTWGTGSVETIYLKLNKHRLTPTALKILRLKDKELEKMKSEKINLYSLRSKRQSAEVEYNKNLGIFGPLCEPKNRTRAYRSFALYILHFAFCTSFLHAQTATQTINFASGWNSVWLEVEPVYEEGDTVLNDINDGSDDETLAAGDSRIGLPKAPEDVFTNTDILVVASPKPLSTVSELFAEDPGVIGTFNQDGWEVWDRNDVTDSNNLSLITGNRAYLIQASAAGSISTAGTAEFFRPTWASDRYNLIGFALDDANIPTFNDFFGPSGSTHLVSKIFSLNTSGNWEVVAGGDSMVSNEAYWVFSSGPSEYMGPVAADFNFSITGLLTYAGPEDVVTVGTGVDELQLDLEEIVFTNLSNVDATPELELIAEDSGSGNLFLHVVTPDPDSLAYNRGNQVDSTPDDGASSSLSEVVAAQSTATLTMGAQRDWSTGLSERINLYRLKTAANGPYFWLPVSAQNSELLSPTDLIPTGSATVAGLWVGEVVLDQVTSIVEDGAPLRPAAGLAPMRILLHSDETGAVSLLSQVTVMQTKTADSETESEPVLVIDPQKIPFFEGIKERNGKRVGLRLEAVAYDMPRKLDEISQAALLADEAYPDLTNASQIEDFLISRSIRPPSLAEVYDYSVSMTGAVGSGKTAEASFTLDPFHRSNPFRHAFHPNHSNGPNISRTMTIVFDEDDSIADRLSASFTETLQGLIKSDLTFSGRVEFQRVSTVTTLN